MKMVNYDVYISLKVRNIPFLETTRASNDFFFLDSIPIYFYFSCELIFCKLLTG